MGSKENLRGVLDEMFFGNDCSLQKCARVRRTAYEIGLYVNSGVPLGELSPECKKYFSMRFLNNQYIHEVSYADLKKAYSKIQYAVDSTIERNKRIISEELNPVLSEMGLKEISDMESFINFFTYNYGVKKDEYGVPVYDRYGSARVECRIWYSYITSFRKEYVRLLNHDKITELNIIALYASRKADLPPKSPDKRGLTKMLDSYTKTIG